MILLNILSLLVRSKHMYTVCTMDGLLKVFYLLRLRPINYTLASWYCSYSICIFMWANLCELICRSEAAWFIGSGGRTCRELRRGRESHYRDMAFLEEWEWENGGKGEIDTTHINITSSHG